MWYKKKNENITFFSVISNSYYIILTVQLVNIVGTHGDSFIKGFGARIGYVHLYQKIHRPHTRTLYKAYEQFSLHRILFTKE